MKKYLVASVFLLVSTAANAQDSSKNLLSGTYPLCARVVDKDVIKALTKFSSKPPNNEKVCECAAELVSKDATYKKVSSLSDGERRALPKAQETVMYLSAKFYSASLSCYADAIRRSADHIDIGR